MRATAGREETREAILDATNRLLARHGYKKMTMDDLAHEVGIGKGTIYLHFPSKEEVVLSHIDRVVERVKQRLRETASREDESPSERLMKMLLVRVLFRFDSVQHYTESLNDLLSALRPGLLARRRRHLEEEAEIIAGVLEEGLRAGEFVFEDALTTARTLLLATNSLLPYSLSARELGRREDVEAQTERIAQLLLHGLLRHSASGDENDGEST